MTNEALRKFVKDNSRFLKLQDNEVFEGFYLASKVTSSKFDPDKDTVVYKLKYEDGKEIFFQTASVAVARTFADFDGGERIKITRHGTGNKTAYRIESPDIKIVADELQPDEELPEDMQI